MPEAIASAQATLPVPHVENCTPGAKALRWFELSLVLLVSFGNSLLTSFYILGGVHPPAPRGFAWISQILKQAAGLLLLGYVLWRRKMKFKDLGLRWSRGDIVAALAVVVAAYLSYAFGYSIIHSVFRSVFPVAASNGIGVREIFGPPSFLMAATLLLNPFFEELIVRAYLMTEIKDLTGSWMLAGAVSVIFQTAYHLYYGWQRALALSFQFLVFSIYYAKTRKATPVILAHGFFDLWGLATLM